MEREQLQNFLDEAEIMISGIRRGILVYTQGDASIAVLDVPVQRIKALRLAAAEVGLREIESTSAALEGDLASILSYQQPASPDRLRSLLDGVSTIESQIATIRMSEESFSAGLNELVDRSFGELDRSASLENDSRRNDMVAEAEFEIDAELLEIFAAEADELIGNIEANLEILSKTPGDKDALWEIRRNAHTFKGSAGIVGLKQPSQLAHRIEDLLDQIHDTDRVSNDRIFPVLREATECLKMMIGGDNSSIVVAAVSKLNADFDHLLETIIEAPAQPEQLTRPVTEAAAEASSQPDAEITKKPDSRAIVRVSLDRLDDMVSVIRDLVVSRSMFEQRLKEFDRQVNELHNAARRLQSTNSRFEVDLGASMLEADRAPGKGFGRPAYPTDGRSVADADHFDPLEFDRYTEFHEAVLELSEASGDTFAINSALETVKDDLQSLFDKQKRLIDGIQEKIMRIRLVAFGTLKTRLERAVRVTCDDESKKADVYLENGELEVDTQILDFLIEPLMHLLKNAVVHGIEYPETRRLIGKPEVGRIDVRLDNEETHIVLRVSDDGGGIVTAALKEKAIGNGLITVVQGDRMSEQEILDLIFVPGLTTAERLNLNAGRGVGMNIVKKTIESRNGTIAIDSSPHRGTTFTVRMPLQLGLTKALLIGTATDTYAIPIKMVKQIVEVDQTYIQTHGSDHKVAIGDAIYELRFIDEFLGFADEPDLGTGPITVVLIETADGIKALSVQKVLKSEEIVIKPLAKPLSELRGVLGAAVVGSGELAPILDVPYFFARGRREKPVTALQDSRSETLTIMAVDDSPSVRHLTSKVIMNAGWNAMVAKDGIDALESLNNSAKLPDVILTDIEMPRMGGYEFVAELKKDERLRPIPVIVITSRGGDKHREKAFENGVTDYLVKPYSDAELIEKIQTLTMLV